MKPNYLGIVGGILALVSLALPWWTMSLSSASGISDSMDVSIYPYMASSSGIGVSLRPYQLWYGWFALILLVTGGVSGIVVGAKPDRAKFFRRPAIGSGGLTLAAVILFAVGLQIELLRGLLKSAFTYLATGWSNVFLFSSGSLSIIEERVSYFAYLSFGFWIALAASFIMFVAFREKTVEASVAPHTPSPPSIQ